MTLPTRAFGQEAAGYPAPVLTSPSATAARTPAAPRLTALDGMRGIAVLAVLAYHAHLPWARGGYLGVDVFFVLSGYLITLQLIKSRGVRGPRASVRFYGLFLAHRATRLLPALLAMLAAAWVLTPYLPIDRSNVGACTARAATYTMNLPSAESLSCPAIWHISWSLAAEVQFYVLWPAALGLIVWAVRRRAASTLRASALTVLGIFTLALSWHLLVLANGGKKHYLFAPDGRSLIILVGCAIALLMARPGARAPRTLVGGRPAGVLAVGVLLACFFAAQANEPVPAVAWYLAVGAATSVLLARAVAPTGAAAPRLLVHPLAAWLGRISYSLYLWHEIAYAAARALPLPLGPHAVIALGVVLAIGAADLSYRLVEVPAQRALRKRIPSPHQRPVSVQPTPVGLAAG